LLDVRRSTFEVSGNDKRPTPTAKTVYSVLADSDQGVAATAARGAKSADFDAQHLVGRGFGRSETSFDEESKMRRTRLIHLAKTKSPWFTVLAIAPLVIVILGLVACVDHPLGDPEKSKIDPRFSGIWEAKGDDGDGGFLFLRPYDSRTYVATFLGYQVKDEGIEPESRTDCKAWLIQVGEATFISMEPLSLGHFAGLKNKPPFIVAKITLADDELSLRLVDGTKDPAKKATSSQELQAVIEQHVASDALYLDDLLVYQRAADKARIRSVLDAFLSKDW
jgi:hypothetical protein